jgi:CRP/FNR family cyclic AMP-dependent transcriptional regulator
MTPSRVGLAYTFRELKMEEKMRPCTPGRPLDPLLNGLGKDVKVVFYRKKQTIFSHGDSSSRLFYIEQGSVKLTVTSSQGKEAVVAVLDGGSFLGHSALVFDRPARSHRAVALTDVRVMRIEPKAMLQLIHTNDDACAAILSSMVKFQTQIIENCADNLLYFAEERLARALLTISRPWGFAGVTPVDKLSQQDLANMIGVSRQRVNGLLKELKKAGFVDYDHGLRVHKSIMKLVAKELG